MSIKSLKGIRDIQHLLIGKNAEQLAVRHLQQHGLQIVSQNYRSRFGEIDIIALDGNTLVFAEVRHRKHMHDAIESIDTHKQRKISRTAEHYIAAQNCMNPCRFDTITIDENKQLRWIKNAFESA